LANIRGMKMSAMHVRGISPDLSRDLDIIVAELKHKGIKTSKNQIANEALRAYAKALKKKHNIA
jgi:hypothetical protein